MGVYPFILAGCSGFIRPKERRSTADKKGGFLKIGDIFQSGTFLKEVCPHTLDEVCPHTFKTPKAMK